MMTRRLAILLLVCVTVTGGCASLRCGDALDHSVMQTLYFGSNMPGGVVSDQEWERFVAEVVTPAFPDGFTVWQARGQWRGNDGQIEQERTWVIQIVGSDLRGAERIASEYKERYHQEAVLRVVAPACVGW